MSYLKEELKDMYTLYICQYGADSPITEEARVRYLDFCVAEESTVRKVCMWLAANIPKLVDGDVVHKVATTDAFIKEFENYMKQ